MSNEVLELKVQAEFDFKMSTYAKREEKDELEKDCRQVVTHAKASVKEMCLLAVQLYEIKEKEIWWNVINPKSGLVFWNNTFDEFCEYAFGFSKTKTSDLLRISQFVNLHGEERGEIEPAYKGYGYSQLVELASVPPTHRVYFNADMSVAEMKVAKDYVKHSAEFLDEKKKEGFDLLEKAQKWKERGKTSVTPKTEQLEGQVALEEVFEEEEKNQLSDFAQGGEWTKTGDQSDEIEPMSDDRSVDGDEYEPDEGEIWQGGGIDREETSDEYDEQGEAQEDMQAEMETIEEAAEREMQAIENEALQKTGNAPKYVLSTRDNIRAFLEDYKNWNYREDIRTPFTKVGYFFTLKTRDIINVLEVDSISNENLLSDAEGLEGAMPLYFLFRAKHVDQPSIMVGKRQLENYLMSKRDEL
ncbi:MAG: hypothetical protein IJ514_08045 [Clostridia bacterium]|nr:hypothetical protein [Clostridia bacterium]